MVRVRLLLGQTIEKEHHSSRVILQALHTILPIQLAQEHIERMFQLLVRNKHILQMEMAHQLQQMFEFIRYIRRVQLEVVDRNQSIIKQLGLMGYRFVRQLTLVSIERIVE